MISVEGGSEFQCALCRSPPIMDNGEWRMARDCIGRALSHEGHPEGWNVWDVAWVPAGWSMARVCAMLFSDVHRSEPPGKPPVRAFLERVLFPLASFPLFLFSSFSSPVAISCELAKRPSLFLLPPQRWNSSREVVSVGTHDDGYSWGR